jgi:chemotaxis protein histidine kinase CheA
MIVSLRKTMTEIFSHTRALAKDLEKPEPRVILEIPEYEISLATDEAMRNSFLHLLRNAMDHGLEKPYERRLAGKEEAGLIELRMEAKGSFLQLSLHDDGRGLDVLRLKNLQLVDPHAEWKTIAQLIFHEGVSTARTVTSISGRGVGMPAVARFMEEIGGRMEIALLAAEPDENGCIPFQLLINLPRQLFHRERKHGVQDVA